MLRMSLAGLAERWKLFVGAILAVCLGVALVQSSLRRSEVRTVAAVARGGLDPEAVRWNGGLAIVVGGEGPGLSDEVVAACDDRVTIPMAPQVESLNVAVAAAILLYTARRHRNTPG